uniref:Os06g0685200 protein n=1 Tax=Macrostomum lignano TaxID=282301 RepID=A0A1I8FQ99_9PLAT
EADKRMRHTCCSPPPPTLWNSTACPACCGPSRRRRAAPSARSSATTAALCGLFFKLECLRSKDAASRGRKCSNGSLGSAPLCGRASSGCSTARPPTPPSPSTRLATASPAQQRPLWLTYDLTRTACPGGSCRTSTAATFCAPMNRPAGRWARPTCTTFCGWVSSRERSKS